MTLARKRTSRQQDENARQRLSMVFRNFANARSPFVIAEADLRRTRKWVASSDTWTCRRFHRFRKPVRRAARNRTRPDNSPCGPKYCCKIQDETARFRPGRSLPSACTCWDRYAHRCRIPDLDRPGSDARTCYRMTSGKPSSPSPR